MTDNVVAFGKPAPVLASATSSAPTPEEARLQLSIDSLLQMLQDNRHKIDSFMGLITFKTAADGTAGFQLFTSPMDLAHFSLGVRVLDGAANAMLHGHSNASRL